MEEDRTPAATRSTLRQARPCYALSLCEDYGRFAEKGRKGGPIAGNPTMLQT